MLLSIVVPVYKEEHNVPEFLQRIVAICEPLTADFEVIFALDPSPDRTEEVILAHRDRDPRVKLLRFSRRFGQPMATLGGLQYARGQAVVVMDVDLQDPPELLVDMVARWREGFDVVYAQRRNRDGETWLKKVVSAAGYRFINKVADVDIPPNTGDFRLMSRRVVDEINRLKECHGFLRGMVALVGFRQTSVLFDRPARFSGQGNYNRFLGSLRIGFNGVFCFSNYALTLSSQLGFLIAGGAFLLALVYLCLKLNGTPFPLGNPTVVILVLLLGGIQLISVGILGEYIGRIYDEVRTRPKFIVERAEGFSPVPPPDPAVVTGPTPPRPGRVPHRPAAMSVPATVSALLAAFPWPTPPGAAASPRWAGGGFEVDGQPRQVLSYDAADSHWSAELTELHEAEAGSHHPIDRASRRLAVRFLRDHLPVGSDDTPPVVLDVGCSSGFVLQDIRQALPGVALIGSDYLLAPLEGLATRMPGLPILQFDLRRCPLPDACVDAVTALNVLEHIDDDDAALCEIVRILRPGGVAYIEVPAGPGLYDLYDEQLMHHRRYRLGDLLDRARAAGFLVLRGSHLGFFLYPAFAWVKRRNRRLLTLPAAEKKRGLPDRFATPAGAGFWRRCWARS